jgi:transposase
LADHQATPDQIASVSIDMSPAFIKGVGEHLPNARVTFDKFHVVAHASAAVDKTLNRPRRTLSRGFDVRRQLPMHSARQLTDFTNICLCGSFLRKSIAPSTAQT